MLEAQTNSSGDALKEVFRRVPTGVAIVCVRGKDGATYGMTANSYTSISLDPPIVGFCVDCAHHNAERYTAAASYVLQFLGSEGAELSQHFAFAPEPRFDAFPQAELWQGIPLLPGIVSAICCTPWQAAMRVGDHFFLTGTLIDTHLPPDPPPRPLIYLSGDYFSAS